jgi:ABC-2 type transport system ATP-binding protein
MSYIIEARDLTRRFGAITAVDRLNIHVRQGEIFGLLGPNGAGKSTAISMLCTILSPTSGTALVNGYDIVRQPSLVRKSIGIVFQDPSVDDLLTGRENLRMHADLYGVPPGEQKERIDEVLALVELEDRADDRVRNYSGGMRRRLEIARSLIHFPRVLFLDEPTIGLDPQSRDHIWSYIRELRKSKDITIILTTHYMDEADRLCDRVAIIDHGVIMALDSPKALKEQLGGETITIKTSDNQLYMDRLGKAGIAKSVAEVDGEVKMTVDNAHTLIPSVVDIAFKAGIKVESIYVQEPQLDDVFMPDTGRAIREGGEKMLSGMAAVRRRSIR